MLSLGLLAFGFVAGGLDLCLNVLRMVFECYKKATGAQSERELNEAADLFARIILRGGVDLLDILVGRRAAAKPAGRGLRSMGTYLSYLEEEMRLWGARQATPAGARPGAVAAVEEEAQVTRTRRTGPNRWRQEPNATYTRNGYTYHTDQQGRITSAEGNLRLDPAPRNQYDQTNVGRGDGRLDGDAGGHLIGSQFGGVGTRENLTAMNHAQINAYPNGEFGRLESRWANALNNGSEVRVRVEPIYESTNTTSRPDRYRVTEWINGEEETYRISNHRPQ